MERFLQGEFEPGDLDHPVLGAYMSHIDLTSQHHGIAAAYPDMQTRIQVGLVRHVAQDFLFSTHRGACTMLRLGFVMDPSYWIRYPNLRSACSGSLALLLDWQGLSTADCRHCFKSLREGAPNKHLRPANLSRPRPWERKRCTSLVITLGMMRGREKPLGQAHHSL